MASASSIVTYIFLAALAHLSCGFTVETNRLVKKEPLAIVDSYTISGTPDTGNANDYMDEVFEAMKVYMDATGLNEYPLPDKVIQFKKTILGITYSGKFGLENGYLRGLDSLHRTGDCTISTSSGDDLTIDTNSGLVNSKLGYSTILKFMGKTLRGSVSGTVDTSSALSTLAVTDLKNITLTYFHITEVGNVTIDITGLGIFNYFADLFSDLIAKMIKNEMPAMLDAPLKKDVQKMIDQIPISDLIPSL